MLIIISNPFGDLIADEIQSSQEGHQNADGVQALVRIGTVGADSGGFNGQRSSHLSGFQIVSGFLRKGFCLRANHVIFPIVSRCHHRLCGSRNDIRGKAGVNFRQNQAFFRGVLLHPRCQLELHISHLSVGQRKLSVRSNTVIRHPILFQIVVHAVPSGFLIQTQNQPNGICRTISRFLEGFHSVQAGNNRSLVVQSTAAEHPAIGDFSGIRIEGPTITLRNDVQMAGNTENFGIRILGFPFNMTAIVVPVLYLEAQFLPQLQGVLICFFHAGAEWIHFSLRTPARLRPDAANANQLLELFQHLRFILFKYFSINHNSSFHRFLINVQFSSCCLPSFSIS